MADHDLPDLEPLPPDRQIISDCLSASLAGATTVRDELVILCSFVIGRLAAGDDVEASVRALCVYTGEYLRLNETAPAGEALN